MQKNRLLIKKFNKNFSNYYDTYPDVLHNHKNYQYYMNNYIQHQEVHILMD
jgi:hypothetical protein